jgi:hypothetical protein
MINVVVNFKNQMYDTDSTNPLVRELSIESPLGIYSVIIDTSIDNGGEDRGARAMPLLLFLNSIFKTSSHIF